MSTNETAPAAASENEQQKASRIAAEALARQARAALSARAEAQGDPVVINPIALDPKDIDRLPHENETPAPTAATTTKADGEPHGDDLSV